MNATIKGALESRTNWAGLLVIVIGYLQQNETFLTLVPAKYQGLITMLIGLAMIVLRFLTTQSLTAKGEGEGRGA